MIGHLAKVNEGRAVMFRQLLRWMLPARNPRSSRNIPPPEAVRAPDPISQWTVALSHSRYDVRIAAARELGRHGTEASKAIPALLQMSVVKDDGVRGAAITALEQIDPDWPRHPEAVKAVPALVEALGAGRSVDPTMASQLIIQIGAVSESALVAALADPADPARQVRVARILGQIDSDVTASVAALEDALASEHVRVREAAAEALSGFGSAATPAVPALVGCLADWSSSVRCAAARSLVKIGDAAEVAIPGLLQLLADKDDAVRVAAFDALAAVGLAAVEPLTEILRAKDVRRMTEWLKWKVEIAEWWQRHDTEDLHREPREALRNASWYFQHAVEVHARVEAVHEAALRLIGTFGADASAAVPAVVQALSDPLPHVRLAAAEALGRIGPHACAGIPDLVTCLLDRSEPVRNAARIALDTIDPAWASLPQVGSAVGFLVDGLGHSGEPGQVAVNAVVAVGPASVPALISVLVSSKDRVVREHAAMALGLIGPGAGEAIPALEKASQQDSHGWVRDAANRALSLIEPDRHDVP